MTTASSAYTHLIIQDPSNLKGKQTFYFANDKGTAKVEAVLPIFLRGLWTSFTKEASDWRFNERLIATSPQVTTIARAQGVTSAEDLTVLTPEQCAHLTADTGCVPIWVGADGTAFTQLNDAKRTLEERLDAATQAARRSSRRRRRKRGKAPTPPPKPATSAAASSSTAASSDATGGTTADSSSSSTSAAPAKDDERPGTPPTGSTPERKRADSSSTPTPSSASESESDSAEAAATSVATSGAAEPTAAAPAPAESTSSEGGNGITPWHMLAFATVSIGLTAAAFVVVRNGTLKAWGLSSP